VRARARGAEGQLRRVIALQNEELEAERGAVAELGAKLAAACRLISSMKERVRALAEEADRLRAAAQTPPQPQPTGAIATLQERHGAAQPAAHERVEGPGSVGGGGGGGAAGGDTCWDADRTARGGWRGTRWRW
jgi:hypothetical protein